MATTAGMVGVKKAIDAGGRRRSDAQREKVNREKSRKHTLSDNKSLIQFTVASK